MPFKEGCTAPIQNGEGRGIDDPAPLAVMTRYDRSSYSVSVVVALIIV